MDPYQTVTNITYGCQQGEWDEVRLQLLDLRDWLNKGGAHPTIALPDPAAASMKDAPVNVFFLLSQLRKRLGTT